MKHILPLVFVVLLVACSSGSTLQVTPGEWVGVIGPTSKFSFTVAPDGKAISMYSFSYQLACSKGPGFEMALSEARLPIKNNQITIKGGASVTLKFTSASTATGEWSVEAKTSPTLGQCKAASGTFNAAPK